MMTHFKASAETNQTLKCSKEYFERQRRWVPDSINSKGSSRRSCFQSRWSVPKHRTNHIFIMQQIRSPESAELSWAPENLSQNIRTICPDIVTIWPSTQIDTIRRYAAEWNEVRQKAVSIKVKQRLNTNSELYQGQKVQQHVPSPFSHFFTHPCVHSQPTAQPFYHPDSLQMNTSVHHQYRQQPQHQYQIFFSIKNAVSKACTFQGLQMLRHFLRLIKIGKFPLLLCIKDYYHISQMHHPML